MTEQDLRELIAGLALAQQKTDEQLARTDAQLAETDKRLARIAIETDKLLRSQQKADAQFAETDAQLARTDGQLAETDKRLASIAIETDKLLRSQQKTDAQLAKTDAQLAKTDAQLAKTDAQLAKTDAQLAKTDAQLAKTDAQLAKTDARLNRLATMYGGVSNNQGAVAEEFYFNSLKHDPVLRGIRFDYVYKNLTGKRRDIQDEYDILLLNGDDVFIIEVKYRAHVRDVETLTGRKTEHFKWLFPLYEGHRLHSGLASFLCG